MKRYSISLVIRKLKIKTTMRYHHMPVRVAIIKRREITNVAVDVKNKTLVHCW